MTQLTPELLPLELLGAREIKEGLIYFGIILPPTMDGETALKSYDLWVRVIHEHDQFLKAIQPIETQLKPGDFSDVACLLYKEATGKEPNSATQAYNYLRNPECSNNSSEPLYIQSLLSYQPNESHNDQPFFWYCTLNLKEEKQCADRDFQKEENLYVYRYCLKKIKERTKDVPDSNPENIAYDLEREIDWIIDPFAREFGQGKLSAFTCGCKKYKWSDSEKDWRVPALNDLIMYEMMFDEFDENIDGAIGKLGYLRDLGINCISLMPITNVDTIVDWGYTPIGYFGIDERFDRSSRQKFKEFMDKAHQHGIAVTFDAVYAHTSPLFCYFALYEQIFISELIAREQQKHCGHLAGEERDECKRRIKENYRDTNKRYEAYDEQGYPGNPFMGMFSRYDFSKSVGFDKKFAQDFFFTVSYYWLDEFHVDGFRYDYVPGFYFPQNLDSIGISGWRDEIRRQINENPEIVNKGFKLLAQEIYNLIEQAKKNAESSLPVDYVERFSNADRLIQASENLDEPDEILSATAANCNWQNQTMRAAEDVAKRDPNYMQNFGHRIGLSFPKKDFLHKTQLQYIENHDNQRFVCNFDPILKQEGGEFKVFKEGDRNLYGYKVQPYLIALLTSKGIPLLWQGQEFCENNYLPPDGGVKGLGRIRMFRPIRWDYFYDDLGQAIISLVRKLTQIRHKGEQFRSLDPTSYYFHNDADRYQSKGVLVYYRFKSCHGQPTEPFSIVMLNFTNEKQTIQFRFPRTSNHTGCFPENYKGTFIDELTGDYSLKIYDDAEITINSNYGRIWTATPTPS